MRRAHRNNCGDNTSRCSEQLFQGVANEWRARTENASTSTDSQFWWWFPSQESDVATLPNSGRDVEGVALHVVQGPGRDAERVGAGLVDPEVRKRHKAIHGEQVARPGQRGARRVRAEADPDRSRVTGRDHATGPQGADPERGRDDVARPSGPRLYEEAEAVGAVGRWWGASRDVERIAERLA